MLKAGTALFVFATLIAFSRMYLYLYVHYPTMFCAARCSEFFAVTRETCASTKSAKCERNMRNHMIVLVKINFDRRFFILKYCSLKNHAV